MYIDSFVEKEKEFTYRGKKYFGELHPFCGWLVCDENRNGVKENSMVERYFYSKLLPQIK